jgi:hypothetical protein
MTLAIGVYGMEWSCVDITSNEEHCDFSGNLKKNVSYEIFCLLRSFEFCISVAFPSSAHRHPGLRKEYINGVFLLLRSHILGNNIYFGRAKEEDEYIAIY